MKKKLFMLSLVLISCVCVLSGVAACTTDENGNTTIHYHEMSEVAAVDATCTTEGNKAYWYCEGCGKYFQDYGATVELSESQVFIAALGHDYTTTFEWAEDYSTATATRVCSHDAAHTETVTAVITSETTDATCTADGSVKYTATATFSDNETATDEKSTTIPATGEHVYSTDWSNNSSYHWQECTICGEIANRAEHSYEITDDKAQCTVCGYVANEALGLDTEKSLTLVDGEANESGYATAASYLYYNTTAAGTYALTLTFDNTMVPYFVDIVVSVNGTVVTGDGYEYIVDLVEGMNYVEISYTGTGATIVLGDYTYTAALSAYVAPVTNDLAMGANTVEEYTTYTFKADNDGYYTFTVSETKGWAAIYSSEDSWSALLDEYGKGQTSYTTQISAGSSITLYFTNGGDGSYVVTVTYSATNPDPDAVTTNVPETLAIGDNAIALSEEDGATGVAATFTATEAGIYSFSISGDSAAYASLGKKYTVSDRSLQVVKSNDPQTYTLEANQTITIYFYSEDDAEYTFNIVFGDTVSTDDDYFKTGTYTIETKYDADYNYYGYKAVYIIKTTGTYTFTLDTTATTGSEVIYFSNDGTLHDTAAELSLSGKTTATYDLTAGNSIYIYVYDYSTTVATTYVFTISMEGDEPAHEHSYEATWNWAADYSSATVTFTCTSGDDTQTVTATVTPSTTAATCTEDGLTTYTATATFNGVEYTDVKTETIPATGHTYGEPVWTWTGYTSATATFTCSACNNERTITTIDITSTTTVEATCTENGETVYTATVTFDGNTYTDTKSETIPATGHTYGEPDWTWAEDYSSATATFTCSTCGDKEEVNADITSETTAATCNGDGSTVYTATATFNEKEYTATKTSAISATGHTYGDPEWTWAADYSSATVTFTCENGDDQQTPSVTVTSETTAATCTENGETVYTATAMFNETVYTKTETVVIPATGHSYGDPDWTWAEDYSTASATFTCTTCSNVETITADISTATGSVGETIYTATATLNGKTYTSTKTVYPAGIFVGTIYNAADLTATSFSAGAEVFEGITIAGTTTVSTYSTSYSSDSSVVEYTDLNGNTVKLTKALSIGNSTKKGVTFTLKSEATIVLYYAVGGLGTTSSPLYINVDNASGETVVQLVPTATSTVMMVEFTLASGTYTIHCSRSSINAYLCAIGISKDALYIAEPNDSLLELEDGYTWNSEIGDTGAFVYESTEYELKSYIGTYTLTVKDSGVYVFTAGTSAVTVGDTTISAGSTATFDLFADDELSITVTADTTLSVQYTDITGNAYGTFDVTLYEDDPDASYTFIPYTGEITLAAGEVAYYRIDTASQDGDGNTSFNLYIYVSGDVDNISVYYSSSKDSENLIAAKDSYKLVTLTEGYYYITLAAKGHGFFKIVANSAATITVTLEEGGDGGTDSGDDEGGSAISYVAMTLDDTMTLDLLDDGNGYYVVYLSYTATEAGSYTLTLSGSHSWWSGSSMLSYLLADITVTVNGETVSSTTGVYSLSLNEGVNTIVINYKVTSSMAATTFTAALATA